MSSSSMSMASDLLAAEDGEGAGGFETEELLWLGRQCLAEQSECTAAADRVQCMAMSAAMTDGKQLAAVGDSLARLEGMAMQTAMSTAKIAQGLGESQEIREAMLVQAATNVGKFEKTTSGRTEHMQAMLLSQAHSLSKLAAAAALAPPSGISPPVAAAGLTVGEWAEVVGEAEAAVACAAAGLKFNPARKKRCGEFGVVVEMLPDSEGGGGVGEAGKRGAGSGGGRHDGSGGGKARVRFEDRVAGRVDVAQLVWPAAALRPAKDPSTARVGGVPSASSSAGTLPDAAGAGSQGTPQRLSGAAALRGRVAERKAARQRLLLEPRHSDIGATDEAAATAAAAAAAAAAAGEASPGAGVSGGGRRTLSIYSRWNQAATASGPRASDVGTRPSVEANEGPAAGG
eukprot:SAG22_NODE_3991_length_1434_cov_2.199251_2_plen_400_part_01